MLGRRIEVVRGRMEEVLKAVYIIIYWVWRRCSAGAAHRGGARARGGDC